MSISPSMLATVIATQVSLPQWKQFRQHDPNLGPIVGSESDFPLTDWSHSFYARTPIILAIFILSGGFGGLVDSAISPPEVTMRFLQDNSTATLHTVGLSRGDAAITYEPRLPIHCKSMLLPNVQYRGAHDFSITTIRCMRLVMIQRK
jgi:hypothetical protein